MTILTTRNAESFGYTPGNQGHGPITGGSSSHIDSSHIPAVGMGSSPNPSIGASINYVQGMQGEGRNQTFAHGTQEAKSPTGDTGIISKAKGMLGGDAAAGGAATTAGEGLAADAAIVAV